MNVRKLTKKEQKDEIWQLLKRHPEGLLIKEIMFLTGFGYYASRGSIRGLQKENRAWGRTIGARNTKLYYRVIQSRRPRKRKQEMDKLKERLETW